jgi:hypothetical protein
MRSVCLKIRKADEMNRKHIMNRCFAIRPGGIEIHAVDFGQQIDVKWRIAELDHIVGKFEILLQEPRVA